MKKNAKVYHADLYGLRDDKYEFLKENSIDSIEWTEIPVSSFIQVRVLISICSNEEII